MFNFSKFLEDKFQTSPRLVAFLNAYGAPAPAVATADKWFQRSSIPSEWLPVLLAYLEIEEGSPVSLKPYVGGNNQ